MIISYNDYLKTGPHQMEGVILLSENDQPVEKALVYITSGEEETTTDEGGTFLLKTWKGLPLEITIEHLEYQTAKYRWEKCCGKIHIKLIKK